MSERVDMHTAKKNVFLEQYPYEKQDNVEAQSRGIHDLENSPIAADFSQSDVVLHKKKIVRGIRSVKNIQNSNEREDTDKNQLETRSENIHAKNSTDGENHYSAYRYKNLAMKAKIIIVDDDQKLAQSIRNTFQQRRKNDVEVQDFADPHDALAYLQNNSVDLAIIDVFMPGMSGLELMRQAKAQHSLMEVVLMTADATIDTATQAVREGAYDYLVKPIDDWDKVFVLVDRALEKKRLLAENQQLIDKLEQVGGRKKLIGYSEEMNKVRSFIKATARSDESVLILGESGTGKELIAHGIHESSPRGKKELIAVNCAVLSGDLLESTLFGHVKYAFTGANSDKKGLFEIADGSTIFLDEIGEMPLETQAKVLRVLQEREIRPVGAVRSIHVDVRVIAATHVDLREAIRQKKFREDLYYRLNVLSLNVPPLRKRRDDIPMLSMMFIRNHCRDTKRDVLEIDSDAMVALCEYPWQGNIRELNNAMHRAAVFCQTSKLQIADLPPEVRDFYAERKTRKPLVQLFQENNDERNQYPFAGTGMITPASSTLANPQALSTNLVELAGSQDERIAQYPPQPATSPPSTANTPSAINTTNTQSPKIEITVDFAEKKFQDVKSNVVETFEKLYLSTILQKHNDNISAAAQAAGLDRSNFKRLLDKYDIRQRKQKNDVESE